MVLHAFVVRNLRPAAFAPNLLGELPAEKAPALIRLPRSPGEARPPITHQLRTCVCIRDSGESHHGFAFLLAASSLPDQTTGRAYESTPLFSTAAGKA